MHLHKVVCKMEGLDGMQLPLFVKCQLHITSGFFPSKTLVQTDTAASQHDSKERFRRSEISWGKKVRHCNTSQLYRA